MMISWFVNMSIGSLMHVVCVTMEETIRMYITQNECLGRLRSHVHRPKAWFIYFIEQIDIPLDLINGN